jgi:hypothetical protein
MRYADSQGRREMDTQVPETWVEARRLTTPIRIERVEQYQILGADREHLIEPPLELASVELVAAIEGVPPIAPPEAGDGCYLIEVYLRPRHARRLAQELERAASALDPDVNVVLLLGQ